MLENLLDTPERTVKEEEENYESVVTALSWNPEQTFLLEEFQNKRILLRNSFEATLCYFVVYPPLPAHLSHLSLTLYLSHLILAVYRTGCQVV